MTKKCVAQPAALISLHQACGLRQINADIFTSDGIIGVAHSQSVEPGVSADILWKVAAGIVVCAGIFGLIRWWQYPPAVEFDNLKYIQLLRTAVSAERQDWLDKVKAAIDQRLAEGQMSSQERRYFDRIIALAESREWAEANRLCFDFEAAQLDRWRRTPATPHDHNHDHEHNHVQDRDGHDHGP